MSFLSRIFAPVALAVSLLFGASLGSVAVAGGQEVTTETGLKIIDTKVGEGASPKTGQNCVMHYTGWLYEGGAKGQKFDSSVDRGQPFDVRDWHGSGHQGLGRGRRLDEGRRQAHAYHPARARLRRAWRRRRHTAQRHAHLRRRAHRGEVAAARAGGGLVTAVHGCCRRPRVRWKAPAYRRKLMMTRGGRWVDVAWRQILP